MTEYSTILIILNDYHVIAPQLRECAANLSTRRLRRAYRQVIALMHGMHHRCKLVHADLSEYNMLYFDRRVWIIDVGQSVRMFI